MITPQEILNSFYIAYWAWLQDGAPVRNKHQFMRGLGLCANLTGMATHEWENLYSAKDIMRAQFISCGMDDSFPFNEQDDYFNESGEHACYRNPRRIEWVRNKVSQLIF